MIFRRPRHTEGALNCIQVGKVLQQYLDDVIDPTTAELVAAHLDDCRRCGMKASEYRQIKRSLAHIAPDTDEAAVARLRDFAARISAGEFEETAPD